MTATLDAPPIALAERFLMAFPTWPPLIHFTTSDLSHMADGRYDTQRIAERLERVHAIVIITPEHLAEMVPLFAESRERRLRLIDALPRVAFLEWSPRFAWSTEATRQPIHHTTTAELRETFLTQEGTPAGWVLERRETERQLGEAEFFQRSAGIAKRIRTGGLNNEQYEHLQQRRVAKYKKENDKHGSNLERAVELTTLLARHATTIQGRLRPFVPDRLRKFVVRRAEAVERFLESVRVPVEAHFMGVKPDNHGFRLWWEVKKKLWSKDMEVGGIGERIDMGEFRWWPVCAMITLDKRVWNATTEALRALGDSRLSLAKDRFLKCGDYNTIVARLDHMFDTLTEWRAQEGREAGGSPPSQQV